MIANNHSTTPSAELAWSHCSDAALPSGAVVQQVDYVATLKPGDCLLHAFPPPIPCQAIVVEEDLASEQSTLPSNRLSILTVPTAAPVADAESLAAIREWVDPSADDDSNQVLLMTLQGVQILWAPGRLAMVAPATRMPALRSSLVETCYYEAELRDIERTMGEAWPQLEADLPLAFEFANESIDVRRQLRQRFQQVLLIRARLARIAPYVHCPHLHPPTLSSQVAERFRERTRMTHRYEFLDDQIQVFERVYEMCSQRASDFMLTRSGNTLEWIIIVLLLVQTVLVGFDLLTTASQ